MQGRRRTVAPTGGGGALGSHCRPPTLACPFRPPLSLPAAVQPPALPVPRARATVVPERCAPLQLREAVVLHCCCCRRHCCCRAGGLTSQHSPTLTDQLRPSHAHPHALPARRRPRFCTLSRRCSATLRWPPLRAARTTPRRRAGWRGSCATRCRGSSCVSAGGRGELGQALLVLGQPEGLRRGCACAHAAAAAAAASSWATAVLSMRDPISQSISMIFHNLDVGRP